MDGVRAVPIEARRAAGHRIDGVQQGRDPDDWTPMRGIGTGPREIHVRDASGAFRVVSLARFGDAVFVRHCFRKTTGNTSRTDIALAKLRYAELVEELGP